MSDDVDASTATEVEWSVIEKTLAGVWREVLQVEIISPQEDFFALGANSIAAMRVTSRLRAIFGIELPLLVVLERSKLCDLAAYCESDDGVGEQTVIGTID